MRFLFNNRILFVLIGLMLVFLISASGAFAQEQKEKELEKKYAPILGKYEFDLTEMGGEVNYVLFYVKEGTIWADFGPGDLATMEPSAGAEFEFTAEMSDGQTFEIKFVKDDQGKYSVCKILIVAMGLEMEGKKIK